MLTTAHFQVIQLAPRDVVLDAKAGKHLDFAIIHGDGEMHDNFASGCAKQLPEPFVQVQLLCCEVEPCTLGFPGVDFLIQSDCRCCDCHKKLSKFSLSGAIRLRLNRSIRNS
jgi:hypothetical protein